MKRCPVCNDFALYEDVQHSCPVCGAMLTSYTPVRKALPAAEPAPSTGSAAAAPVRPKSGPKRTIAEQPKHSAAGSPEPSSAEPVRPVRTIHSMRPEAVSNGGTPAFETREGLNLVCRGMVTEVSYQARFHSTFKKCVNSVFHSEPYQFANTSHLTVFRIEGFHPARASGPRRDFVFYGDVEGRFVYGDDVTVTARRKGDRYIVKRLYSNETQTNIRPAPQISSAVAKVLFALLVLLAVLFLVSAVGFIASGAFLQLIGLMFRWALMILFGYWLLRGLFG